eukprot:1217624-Alexandrium_andersonii.AAC.1
MPAVLPFAQSRQLGPSECSPARFRCWSWREPGRGAPRPLPLRPEPRAPAQPEHGQRPHERGPP